MNKVRQPAHFQLIAIMITVFLCLPVHFVVAAADQSAGGKDDPSAKQITVKHKKSLKAESVKKKVKLTWKEAKNASVYKVFRKTGKETYQVIKETTKIKFTDKGIKTDRYYKYKVKAYNAEGNKIAVYNVVKVFAVSTDPKKKMVALTFDDGPGQYTTDLVKALKKHHARATFFVVGSNIKRYHQAMEKAWDAGCEIGNHTWDHCYLTDLSKSKMKKNVAKTDNLIKKYTGQESRLLRPPYGATSGKVSKAIKKPQILWSIDTRDWETRSEKATIKAVMKNVRDGDVILIHDIHKPSVAAAKKLIPKLQKKGYQLVTVSELAKYKDKKLKKGKKYGRIH